jgi:hypothetical protein
VVRCGPENPEPPTRLGPPPQLPWTEELMGINAHILQKELGGFRGTPVICVDTFGREIHFVSADEVPRNIGNMLEVFADDFSKAREYFALSVSFAKLFYSLIAIHPFENANRRTAVEFLMRRAKEKGYSLHSTDLLKKVLFEGNVGHELRILSLLFSQLLRPL